MSARALSTRVAGIRRPSGGRPRGPVRSPGGSGPVSHSRGARRRASAAPRRPAATARRRPSGRRPRWRRGCTSCRACRRVYPLLAGGANPAVSIGKLLPPRLSGPIVLAWAATANSPSAGGGFLSLTSYYTTEFTMRRKGERHETADGRNGGPACRGGCRDGAVLREKWPARRTGPEAVRIPGIRRGDGPPAPLHPAGQGAWVHPQRDQGVAVAAVFRTTLRRRAEPGRGQGRRD